VNERVGGVGVRQSVFGKSIKTGYLDCRGLNLHWNSLLLNDSELSGVSVVCVDVMSGCDLHISK
jgi:hypothetical protein